MKIREMSPEEKRAYYRLKLKQWRLKNPEKNKEQRIKYKKSEKGRIANRKYELVYHRKKMNNPTSHKQYKEYMNNYVKIYMKDEENHRKKLIRMRDNHNLRKELLSQQGFCQLCGSQLNLEIHHKNYDESKDVIILCRLCHKKLHRKY
jgi:hypothetical protein